MADIATETTADEREARTVETNEGGDAPLVPLGSFDELIEGGEPVESILTPNQAPAAEASSDDGGSEEIGEPGDESSDPDSGDKPAEGQTATPAGDMQLVQINGQMQLVTKVVAEHLNRLQGNQGDESTLRNENLKLQAKLQQQTQTKPEDQKPVDVQLPAEALAAIASFDQVLADQNPDLKGKFTSMMGALTNQIASTIDERYRGVFNQVVDHFESFETQMGGFTNSMGDIQLERAVTTAITASGEQLPPDTVLEAYNLVRTDELSRGATEVELDSRFARESIMNRAIQGVKSLSEQSSVDNADTAGDNGALGEAELQQLLNQRGGSAADLLRRINNRTGSIKRRPLGQSTTATKAKSDNSDRNRRPETRLQDDNEKVHRLLKAAGLAR